MHVKSSIAAAIGIAGLVSAAPLERRQGSFGLDSLSGDKHQSSEGGFGNILSNPLDSVNGIVGGGRRGGGSSLLSTGSGDDEEGSPFESLSSIGGGGGGLGNILRKRDKQNKQNYDPDDYGNDDNDDEDCVDQCKDNCKQYFQGNNEEQCEDRCPDACQQFSQFSTNSFGGGGRRGRGSGFGDRFSSNSFSGDGGRGLERRQDGQFGTESLGDGREGSSLSSFGGGRRPGRYGNNNRYGNTFSNSEDLDPGDRAFCSIFSQISDNGRNSYSKRDNRGWQDDLEGCPLKSQRGSGRNQRFSGLQNYGNEEDSFNGGGRGGRGGSRLSGNPLQSFGGGGDGGDGN